MYVLSHKGCVCIGLAWLQLLSSSATIFYLLFGLKSGVRSCDTNMISVSEPTNYQQISNTY